MPTRVSLVDCPTYDFDAVYGALRACLAPLGGLGAFVRPGQRALLQPNLIAPRPPGDAVCTHPSVVRAACRLVREAGGVPLVGGSAGAVGLAYHRTRDTLDVSGIAAAAAAEGAEVLNYDEESGQAAVDDAGDGDLGLAGQVLAADVLITLPKAKTHNLTLFTGAVKNHVGALPGRRKLALHRRFAEPDRFGEALLDLYLAAPPRLAIMDAVEGMDGDGPTGGQARPVGVLAASADGVALDTVVCEVCGLDPGQVTYLAAARRRGVGATSPDEIEVVGLPLAAARARVRPFRYPATYRMAVRSWLPGRVWSWAMRFVETYPTPYVLDEKCVGCGVCARSCPARTIDMVEEKARIDLRDCISCFCCHELCPHQAIGVHVPWALRLARGREAAALGRRRPPSG